MDAAERQWASVAYSQPSMRPKQHNPNAGGKGVEAPEVDVFSGQNIEEPAEETPAEEVPADEQDAQ